MPAARADAGLLKCLEEIRARHGDSVKTRDVVEVVHSALSTLSGDLTAADVVLYGELEELARVIRKAKAEIRSIRPEQVKDEYLPAAADELDAIVAATADATNVIMDATEIIEKVMAETEGSHAERLMDATTRIYEACGFQDITGQRITKVVGVLKDIEEKVDALLGTFGANEVRSRAESRTNAEPQSDTADDGDLLHGPQLPKDAMSQAQIDLLLASFN
jgi:chemotaxis protein CheZ